MAVRSSSSPFLPTIGIALALLLSVSLLLSLGEIGGIESILLGALSRFLHFLPLALIVAILFNLFFFSNSSDLNWGNFFLPMIILTLIQIGSSLLLEPAINAMIKNRLEQKILYERIDRYLERLESELADSRTKLRNQENESILAVYRENLNQRLKILRQLEGLYGFLYSLEENQNMVQDRKEAIRLQREEVEKNLIRLPFIETTRRLNWNDFSNLTATSALVLAQELFNRKQWPECYQIATLAGILGDTSRNSERLRNASREELLKLPITDGNFFARKKRAIELYQSGLIEASYYSLIQLEREHFFDEEVLTYLNLSRTAMLRNSVFIEDARLSLEVPLYRNIVIVQQSLEIPTTQELIFIDWVSPSPYGYLLERPRILRRYADGTWKTYEAEMGRYLFHPEKNAWVIEFDFRFETLNQGQKRSAGFDFSSLRLAQPLEHQLAQSLVAFRPEFLGLHQLWDSAAGIDTSFKYQALSEILMRFLSGPLFLVGLLVLSTLALSYKKSHHYHFTDQVISMVFLIPGLYLIFENLHWALRISLASLTALMGWIAALVLAGLAILAVLVLSLFFLRKVMK